MKIAQRTSGGNLTQVLAQVEQELESLQDDTREILRSLEGNKEAIVAQAIAVTVREADPNKRVFLEGVIEENIDDALADIHRARNLVGRLSTVTRNVIEISRRAEKTWHDTLMDFIRETKWYRERFPVQYEERRRRKEYERFRMRPEQFHPRPWRGEEAPGAMRGPELEEMRIPAAARISNPLFQKRAQLEPIAEAIESVFRRLFQIMQTYYMADSPVLQAANRVVGRIKKRMGKQLDSAKARGLKDQLQVLENLFGFEQQPGRYLTSGGRAFLLPVARMLQDALTKLQEPARQAGLAETVTEELAQELQLPTTNIPAVEQQTPTAPSQPGGLLQSHMKRTLERLSRFTNRQKRCHVIQRIASSR